MQLYSRVTFGEACLDTKTTMHMIGPNDLATLNLTVIQYCIIRRIMTSFPKFGGHYSQITYILFSKLFQHNLQRPRHVCCAYKQITLILLLYTLHNHTTDTTTCANPTVHT